MSEKKIEKQFKIIESLYAERDIRRFNKIKLLESENARLKERLQNGCDTHEHENDLLEKLVSELKAEVEKYRHREKNCETLTEAKYCALLRLIGESATTLGMSLDVSPADILAEVKGLKQEVDRLNTELGKHLDDRQDY